MTLAPPSLLKEKAPDIIDHQNVADASPILQGSEMRLTGEQRQNTHL